MISGTIAEELLGRKVNAKAWGKEQGREPHTLSSSRVPARHPAPHWSLSRRVLFCLC